MNDIVQNIKSVNMIRKMIRFGGCCLTEEEHNKLRKFRSDISTEINISNDRNRIKSLKKYVKTVSYLIEYCEGTSKSNFNTEFPIELESRLDTILFGLFFSDKIESYTYHAEDLDKFLLTTESKSVIL